MLSLRFPRLTAVQFVQMYLREYHSVLAEAVDSKSADAAAKMIELTGTSYSKVAMFSSFVKFLSEKQKDQDDKAFLLKLHEDLEAYITKEFPKILILMNINGCLVHRTGERIQFLKPSDPEERADPKWQRYVTMFKQKK